MAKHYGVWPHIDNAGRLSGGGFVVRTLDVADDGSTSVAYPYSLLAPVKVYKRCSAAMRLAYKLSYDAEFLRQFA